jgi:hypothetical protein
MSKLVLSINGLKNIFVGTSDGGGFEDKLGVFSLIPASIPNAGFVKINYCRFNWEGAT